MLDVETMYILTKPKEVADVHSWGERIGLSALNVVLKGQPHSPSPKSQISEDSYWVFGIDQTMAKSVSTQVSEVIDPLYSKKDSILRLMDELNLFAECNTYFWPTNDQYCSVEFDSDLIRKITELRISFTLIRY